MNRQGEILLSFLKMGYIKHLIFFMLIVLFSCPVKAQEKWSDETCSYTNHQWHFHWNLDKDFKWEHNQGNEKHTVFKAVSPYGLMAYVNINPFTEVDQDKWDLWEHFEEYKNILKTSWNKVSDRTGGKIDPLKIDKCRFAGENAIKVIVKSMIKDDVHDEISYSYTYTFHKDGATWSATVMTSPDVWNLIGEEGVKELFIKFGPNAK